MEDSRPRLSMGKRRRLPHTFILISTNDNLLGDGR
jgi:hypothetical protein